MKVLRALGAMALGFLFLGLGVTSWFLHWMLVAQLLPNLPMPVVGLLVLFSADALPLWFLIEAWFFGIGATAPIMACLLGSLSAWAGVIAIWPVRGQLVRRVPVHFTWRWISSGYVLAKIAELTLEIPWDRIEQKISELRSRR